MSLAATEAVITILSGKFFGEAGEGTRYLRSGDMPEDLRDIAIDVTTMFGDEVARVIEAVNSSPALRSELDALPEDWGEENLFPLKAVLVAAGLL